MGLYPTTRLRYTSSRRITRSAEKPSKQEAFRKPLETKNGKTPDFIEYATAPARLSLNMFEHVCIDAGADAAIRRCLPSEET